MSCGKIKPCKYRCMTLEMHLLYHRGDPNICKDMLRYLSAGLKT